MNVKRGSFEHEFESGKRTKLTRKQQSMIWRRQQVFSLLVKGTTDTYEISQVCNTSQSTVVRDLQFLKSQSIEQMKFHIRERVPWAYRICSERINEVLRHAWSLLLPDSKINKVAILALIEQCYKDKLEVSTNSLVITQALEQVEMMKEQILGFYNPKTKDSLSTPIIAPVR